MAKNKKMKTQKETIHAEACKRMKALGIAEDAIELFRQQERPLTWSSGAYSTAISEEQKRACRQLVADEKEADEDCIAYFVMHEEAAGRPAEYVLFVDSFADDWKSFYDGLQDFPYVIMYAFYPQQGCGEYIDGVFFIDDNGIPNAVNLDAGIDSVRERPASDFIEV